MNAPSRGLTLAVPGSFGTQSQPTLAPRIPADMIRSVIINELRNRGEIQTSLSDESLARVIEVSSEKRVFQSNTVDVYTLQDDESWLEFKATQMREVIFEYARVIEANMTSRWFIAKTDDSHDEIRFVNADFFRLFPEAFEDLCSTGAIKHGDIPGTFVRHILHAIRSVTELDTDFSGRVDTLEEERKCFTKFATKGVDGAVVEGLMGVWELQRGVEALDFYATLICVRAGDDDCLFVFSTMMEPYSAFERQREFTVRPIQDRTLVTVNGNAAYYGLDIYDTDRMADQNSRSSGPFGVGAPIINQSSTCPGFVDHQQLMQDNSSVCQCLYGEFDILLLNQHKRGEVITSNPYHEEAEDVVNHLVMLEDKDLPWAPYVSVFDSVRKRWCVTHVDSLKDAQFNASLYDEVVLPDDNKTFIHDVLRAQDVSLDSVEGKGNNIVMLFMGGPGTGKTLTVEAMSHKLKRGLLKTSSCDLGSTPETIEARLSAWARLASRWNAFLFIDESDVFITRREVTDMTRNSIVNSFLKTLEYFNGTLFLTTNNIQYIDSAIASRITYSRTFEMSDSDMRTLWFNLMKKAGVRQPSKTMLDKVEDSGLDGRQIKNVIENTLRVCSVRGTKISSKAVLETFNAMNH